MSYSFVHTQRSQFPLRVLCRTAGVTESGYHSWRVIGSPLTDPANRLESVFIG